MLEIPVNTLPHAMGLELPAYATEGSAGLDLSAALDEAIILRPFHRRKIPTGISIALPEGYEAQIRPRSGLALHHGVTILNAPGTIDADYRGEIAVILVNLGQGAFTVTRGMRIAQMVIAPVIRARLVPVEATHEPTERAEGGFGSTGIHHSSQGK
jgi:dUTP pyrophosphatase